MKSLIEYDSDDKQTKNKVSSFASTDWNWLNPDGVNTEYQNNSVVKNVFQAFDILRRQNGVDFNLTTIFFKEDGEINDGVDVGRNTLKFNVDVENWPFESDDNYLKLCINLMTNGANDNDNDTDNNWSAGDFNIYTLDEAECGGNAENDTLSVNVDDDTNDDSDNQRDLCFKFEYCESGNIYYDPIITYDGNTNPDSGSGSSTSSGDGVAIGVGVTFGVLGFIGLVAGGYYCYRKKSSDGMYRGLLEN